MQMKFRIFNSYHKFEQKLFHEVEEWNKNRTKKRVTLKYDKKITVYFLYLILILSIFYFYNSFKQDRTISQIINTDSSSFLQIKEGSISFGSSAKKHKIELPFLNIDTLDGFSKSEIWYHFKVIIPEEFKSKKNLGLFIPKIKGDFEVFIDDKTQNIGKNTSIYLPVLKESFNLSIRIDARAYSSYGIRSTIPLVAGDINTLRSFSDIIYKQYFMYEKSLMLHMCILFIFLLIFLLIREKPEIFSFSMFFVANIAYQYSYALYAYWGKALNIPIGFALATVSLFLLLRSFAILVFVSDYFRIPKSYDKKAKRSFIQLFLILNIFTFIIAQKQGNLIFPLFNLAHIVTSFSLILTIGFLFIRYQMNLKYYQRAISSLVLMTAIGYSSVLEVVDITNYFSTVTRLHINHIYTYLIVAFITLFEYSRTHKKHKKYQKNLCIENQEIENRDFLKSSVYHEGFIVLTDVINFTLIKEKLNEEKIHLFLDHINQHHFKFFKGWSILNQVGDGFYFAGKDEFSEEKLTKHIQNVSEFVEKRVSLSALGFPELKDIEIGFRASIGYGKYFTGISRSIDGEQVKEFAGGKILDDLSRINGGREPNLNILKNRYIQKHPQSDDLKAKTLTAKHGKQFHVFDVDFEIKKAS